MTAKRYGVHVSKIISRPAGSFVPSQKGKHLKQYRKGEITYGSLICDIEETPLEYK